MLKWSRLLVDTSDDLSAIGRKQSIRMAQVQQRALLRVSTAPWIRNGVPSRGRQRIVAHRIDCSMTLIRRIQS